MEEMGELLAPWQLGYGVRRGAEAAILSHLIPTISLPIINS